MRRESTSSEKQKSTAPPAVTAVYGKPPTRPPRPATKNASKVTLAMEPTNRALFPPLTRRNADPLTSPPLQLQPEEQNQLAKAAPLVHPTSDIDFAEAPAERSVRGGGVGEDEMQRMDDGFGVDEADFHAGTFADAAAVPLHDAAAYRPSHASHKAVPLAENASGGSSSVHAAPHAKPQQVVPPVGLASWRTKPVSSAVSASAATSATATLLHNAQDHYASTVADDADAKVGSKRPLSSIGAKLAASRADLDHTIAANATAATTVKTTSHVQGQDQENRQPNATGSLQVPSFTQTLKAASQLSADSYASQPASPRSATSTAHAPHRPLQEADVGPLFKKQKSVPLKHHQQVQQQAQQRRGGYKSGITEEDSDGEEGDLAGQLRRATDKYGSGSPADSVVSGSGSSMGDQEIIGA